MRPIKTSKSNYFVIHMGMAAEYEMKDKILTEMGIEWQKNSLNMQWKDIKFM